jgi:hypothetical protein
MARYLLQVSSFFILTLDAAVDHADTIYAFTFIEPWLI